MENMEYIGGANLENVILSPFDVCILPSSAVMKTLQVEEKRSLQQYGLIAGHRSLTRQKEATHSKRNFNVTLESHGQLTLCFPDPKRYREIDKL